MARDVQSVAGGKLATGHKGVLPPVKKLVEALQPREEVTRISLERLRLKSSPPKRLKIHEINGGLRVTAWTANGVQTIIVYTTDPEATAACLRETFDRL